MDSRNLTVVLTLTLAFSLLLAASSAREFRLPGNDRGYEPDQPLRYSHRLHAGELGIPCLYCHTGAEKSRHAGIPSLSTCMNCHAQVTAPFLEVRAESLAAEAEGRKPRRLISDEIRKMYRAMGLDDEGRRDPSLRETPVAWTRVHNLPAFTYFDHRPHVVAGVACQVCHGPVETMEKVRQHADLSMGWCVNCHRTEKIDAPLFAWPKTVSDLHRHASTDCGSCHY